jgi:hypothetical protein
MNRRLLSTLHSQRAALVALRDRALPTARWMHDEEIRRIDERLGDARSLQVTAEDEIVERRRAAYGTRAPRQLRQPGSRRTPRARPAAHRPSARGAVATAGAESSDPDLGDPEPGPQGGR